MSGPADEDQRSLVFAEKALGQIKSLHQAATPRNYEVWYAYAAGHYPSLNQKINEALSQSRALSQTDLDQIHETYLSPARLDERIDTVGSQVMGELEEVMTMIDAATSSASSYNEKLAGVTKKLGTSTDRDGLRAIIEGLVQSTGEMNANNRMLQERLNATKQEINALHLNLEAVRTESLTDPMTQLANRKCFDTTLEQAIAEACAKNEPLSLLVADVDHFKRINDSFGHLMGDHVLHLIAMTVKANVKGKDTAARYGGEEFAIVLPNTALHAAVKVADHIRCAVMAKELRKRSSGELLGQVTISIGAATLRNSDTVMTFIGRADACLYACKRHGRNRVMCETDQEVSANGASTAA